MGTISVKDQNGNPVAGIDIELYRRDKLSEVLWRQYPDLVGHTDFHYSALGVKTFNHYGDDVKFNLLLNRVEGLNPNWKDFEQAKMVEIDALNPDAGAEIVLKRNSVQPPNDCPVDHNKEQFTNWFNKNKVGTLCTHDNMHAMLPAMEKCGMVWQNQLVYSEDRWRPRIFLAPLTPPNYDSPWAIDCGNFDGVWELTFRY